ncbi:MAG TPA: hypothetical protein DCP63_09180 [Bacteroidetes bacterium]|nr:hypothetical protein [Bacteroidota bacterium]
MLEKPNKLRVSLIGGTVIGAVSGIPGLNLINCCCCAGIWLGGFLTMYLYKQQLTEEMIPMESSDALLLGLMSGVAGAFVASFIGVLLLVTFGPVGEELVKSLFDRLFERMAESGSIPSDAIDQFKEQLEQSLRDSSKPSSILDNLFLSLIAYPMFSILGALLGYAVFKPKSPPQTTPAH